MLQIAVASRLNTTASGAIGIGLLRGLRDARFLGSVALACAYCDLTLQAAARKFPPQMDEVIRLLQTLNHERRQFGPLNEVPWEATLQRLAKTYVVQLPIPADAPPQTGDELPIPADEVSPSALNLPAPSADVPAPKQGFWRRSGESTES